MSVLSAKDIQAFAKMINTSNPESNNKYSIPGTVVSINDPLSLVTEEGESYEYTAQVQLDGGSSDYLCTASYNGIICSVGDRVVVTIDNGTATITENYTNPNGNDIIIKEVFVDEEGDTPTDGNVATDHSFKYVYLTKTISDLPEDYEIIGLKSVGIQIKKYTGGYTWDWADISTNEESSEGENKVFAAHIHIGGWNFDGKTVTITLNVSNRVISETVYGPVNGTYKLRARVLVSCMLKTKLKYVPVGEN